MKFLIHLVFCAAIQILVLNVNLINAANILFFFGVSTYSHRITVWPLVEKLVELGHNVSYFQPFHSKNPQSKVKEIFPIEVEKFMETIKTQMEENWLNSRLKGGHIGNTKILLKYLPMMGVKLCDAFLSSQETIEWINNSQIDLIVIDALFNECAYGLAHKFNAKTIIFGTTTVFSWWYDDFGFPAENNWLADLIMSSPYPLNYFTKTMTTLFTLGFHYYKSVYYFPELEHILRTKLNMPDMPGISELTKKVNLVLMNTHPSEEFARSLPPLIIPIGGMHCDSSVGKKKSEIPKEISNFIKNEEGFIYVSFGSEANIGEAPEEFQKIFYTAFGNSKIKFVWKWEGARPKQMPPNVITAKWMPQQEILAQPNIKAFISHGGLLSIQEAITFEVPMIVFPVFAEQDYNSYRIARTGRGIHLDVQTLTVNQLQSAVIEIQTNKSYKDNMKRTAALFKDRPQTPLETAVWWTEYVLRNKDTSHLMPLAVDQSWFERRLLDVWVGIAFVSIVILLIVYYILKSFLKVINLILFQSNPNTNSEKVKSPKKSPKVKRT